MIRLKLYEDLFVLDKNDLDIYKEPMDANLMIKLLSVDCKMKLRIDKKLYVDDWVCPLELYYQFKKWEENIYLNRFIDFEYNSMETDNNPVFCFIYDKKADNWKIDGRFKNYNENETFETEDLIQLILALKNQLINHIK